MLEPGLSATIERVVTQDMTAERLGSGDVAVLGTPAVLALAEAASVAAVRAELQPDQTTVGVSIELEHLAPTPVGGEVRATATLAGIEDRRLRFDVTAHDGVGEIARGTHTRAVVDRDRFTETATKRLS